MLRFIKDNKTLVGGFVVIFAFGVLLLLPKMSLEHRLISSGKTYQERRQWAEAAEEFERAVRYAPGSSSGLEAARLGGGICLYELKDYLKAVFFFRHIVRHGQRPAEIRWAQQKLAEVFYEKLS